MKRPHRLAVTCHDNFPTFLARTKARVGKIRLQSTLLNMFPLLTRTAASKEIKEIIMSHTPSPNENRTTGMFKLASLSKVGALFAAILALTLPGRVTAQVDCDQCVHGGALLENAFGTNCLGQLAAGKTHVGDTVFVRLILRNVDCCPVPNTPPFESPFIDWHLVTNVVDSVNYGCTTLQTANLLTNGPILVNQCFDPFDPSTSYAVSNLTFAGQIFAYKYTVPACLVCTTNPIQVAHSSISIGRDTNSFCNPNGQIAGGGSSLLTVLCPRLCIGKQCVDGVGQDGSISWTASVTNCGNATLTNVTVTHFINGTNQIVVGPTTLTAGQVTNFGGSYMPTNICTTSTDSLVVQGTDELVCTVSATATATCSIITTPCVGVTKNCTTAVAGQPQTISGVVTNCGNVALANIVVSDNVVGAITNVSSLAVGGSFSYSKTVTAVCGNVTNVVTAVASSICGVPVIARATNTCVGLCPPQICVSKQVACFLGTNGQGAEICGTFGESATGYKVETATSTNLPTFCYSISVSNCGAIALTNVTVIDDKYGDLTTNFFADPTTVFPVNGSLTFTFKTALNADLTNTVIVTGQSTQTGEQVGTNDIAQALVLPASIACHSFVTSANDLDGNPSDNHVTLPDDGSPHDVTYNLIVTNTGQANLINITLSDTTLAALECDPVTPFSLAIGGSTNFTCTVSINCTNIPTGGLTNSAIITGQIDTSNGGCNIDTNGNPISVSNANNGAPCSSVIECRPIGTCSLSVTKTACVSPPQQQCPCVLGYPFVSANPRTSVVFNENECLAAFGPSFAGSNDTLKVWYTDEHAMTLGVRKVIVKTSGGSTTNLYPVTPLNAVPDSSVNPQVGTTALSGDQAGIDPFERPIWPSLFITDITDDPTSRANDWQYGGTPILPNAIFGTWKGAVKTVDKTVVPTTITITPDVDPAVNGSNLGAGDPAPAGSISQKYGAEARWNISDLIAAGIMTNGRIYRVQVMVHDGDQNKVGGDVGETCGTVALGTGTTCSGGTNVQVTCTTTLPDVSANASCDGAIKTFNFAYVGGGCANMQNSQGASATCTTYVSSTNASPVRLRITDGGGSKVFLDTGTPANVHLADVVSVAAGKKADDHFPADIVINIYNTNNTLIERVKFKADCSQPVKLGDVFGGIQVVGFNGLSGGNSALGSSVLYSYEIKNEGSGTLTNITVVDDMLGTIPGSPIPSLTPGQIVTLTEQVWITDPVTNTVTVTGFQGNTQCSATGLAVVTRTPVPCPCTLGYPFASSNPRTSVIFNESECLRAFSPTLAGSNDTLKIWYNDEHALTLGIRRVIVKTSATTSNVTDYPITPLTSVPDSANNPLIGAPALTGPQAGVDPSERPIWPALFITDITDNPTSRSNDWQYGGTPIPPNAIFGAWKGAIKTVDQTVVPAKIIVTPEADPAKNDPLGNTRLGPNGDIPPFGFGGTYPTANGSKTFNEGYTFEARWNIADLIAAGIMTNGRVYRVQFMVHDGDQNKTGGDVGENCATVGLGVQPPPCAPATPPPAECTSGIVAFLVKWTGTDLAPGSTLMFLGSSGATVSYTFATGLTNGATISLPAEGDPGRPWTIDATKHAQTKLGTKTYVYLNGVLKEILHTSCSCSMNNFIPGQPACLDAGSPDNASGIKGAPSPLFQVLDFKN